MTFKSFSSYSLRPLSTFTYRLMSDEFTGHAILTEHVKMLQHENVEIADGDHQMSPFAALEEYEGVAGDHDLSAYRG
jgi:hypothetical protein